MYSPFHLHAEPLLIGLLVAWISLRRHAWVQPMPDSRVALRVLAGSGAVAVAAVALRMLNREVFAYLALGCVYGAALCIALADRSILTAVLRWRIWYPIARLSFGMYLNHLVLREPTDTIIALVNRTLGTGTHAAFLLGLLLTILASALTAAVTFVLVEQPGLAMRDRWLMRREARPPLVRTVASP
jgi:peptidoglycan/LPS O-acetylase OafA/YrhL